ncbi:hypothetical protein [Paraburkholderia ginsengisoli]|uniref:Uncharacterized protein n=1 Tax=Paraburkholderia ginsengisoli TaxID=311231 RepID=A0A7T4N7B5_9BURK|nr:hypothetical protein [Paraburkholderia ginsengisoli]QQC66547.1 hypothetical protein I6I06_27700 [Paraburkholderia ginsengisoli]
MLGNEYNALATDHRLKGLDNLEVGASLQKTPVPVKVAAKEVAHALNEGGIASPHVSVGTLSKFFTFLNRLLLPGS